MSSFFKGKEDTVHWKLFGELQKVKGCTNIFRALYKYVQYCVPAEGPVGPWVLKAAVLVHPSELSL